MANGYRLEDLLKDYEEAPWQTSAGYFLRLPVLGRYMGLIGEAANTIVTGMPGATPGAFIPGAAALNLGRGVIRAGKGWYDDKPTAVQDSINSMRWIPFLGDSVTRTAVYWGTADLIERRKRRSKAGGGSAGARKAPAVHYGLHKQEINFTYPRLAGMLIESIDPNKTWSRYDDKQNFKLPMSAPTPQPPAPQQPEVPQERVEAPVTAQEQPSIQESILQSNRPQAAPESLLE
jgi:hypothetical protein